MGSRSRPPTCRCKKRRRISGTKSGTKMCNSGDDRKLNRGAGHINSHGEVNGEVDAVKHPIGCGGPCVNAHGELYVPDSEEEEPDMKVEPDSHDICIRVMKKNTTFSINLECPFVLLMTNKIVVQSYENQRRFM